jgi:hypothetical protein
LGPAAAAWMHTTPAVFFGGERARGEGGGEGGGARGEGGGEGGRARGEGKGGGAGGAGGVHVTMGHVTCQEVRKDACILRPPSYMVL